MTGLAGVLLAPHRSFKYTVAGDLLPAMRFAALKKSGFLAFA